MDANTHVCRNCGRRFDRGHDGGCTSLGSQGGYESVDTTWLVGEGRTAVKHDWVSTAEVLAYFIAQHMKETGVSADQACYDCS